MGDDWGGCFVWTSGGCVSSLKFTGSATVPGKLKLSLFVAIEISVIEEDLEKRARMDWMC